MLDPGGRHHAKNRACCVCRCDLSCRARSCTATSAGRPARRTRLVEDRGQDLRSRQPHVHARGLRGNTTIAAGDDGVIMVDGQFAQMHDKLKAAIAAVTQQPVRFLVNTHYHRDHVGGNAPFSKDGAVVVAHENVRKSLAEGTTMAVPEVKYTPAPEEALPAMTHKDGMTLAGERPRRAAQASAQCAHRRRHVRVFCRRKCLATGDTVAMGRYPNIDFANGGSLKGMIAASDAFSRSPTTGPRSCPAMDRLPPRRSSQNSGRCCRPCATV